MGSNMGSFNGTLGSIGDGQREGKLGGGNKDDDIHDVQTTLCARHREYRNETALGSRNRRYRDDSGVGWNVSAYTQII